LPCRLELGDDGVPPVDAPVVVAFAEQLRYVVPQSRAGELLRNTNKANGGNGSPVVVVPEFLGLFGGVVGGGATTSNGGAGGALAGSARTAGYPDTAGYPETLTSNASAPVDPRVQHDQQRQQLKQQRGPSPRLRELVLQQRVENLQPLEHQLVSNLREALFERWSTMKRRFESCDLNGDGIVTLEEFLHALEGAGVAVGHEIDRARASVSVEEAAHIMAFFDRDGQGVLQYNEFMRLLQGVVELPSSDPMSSIGSPLRSAAHGWR